MGAKPPVFSFLARNSLICDSLKASANELVRAMLFYRVKKLPIATFPLKNPKKFKCKNPKFFKIFKKFHKNSYKFKSIFTFFKTLKILQIL